MQGIAEDLPLGWASTTLGGICDKPEYGWTTKAANSGPGPKLLRTTDISKGVIDWSTVPVCTQVPPSLDKYLLKKEDIVVSRAGSVGLSALIGDCPEAVFASYLIRFRAHREISVEYLHNFLKSPSYWEQIAQESAGIALQNVNAKKLAALTVPLPPLPEQHRIVAEIEKQFTRLDASESALKRAQANLRRYRASVLKAACEGKLVPTEAALAQAEGRDYEPADQLLERILAERRARWEAQGKKKSKYKEAASPDTAAQLELPEGWVWSSLGECFEVHVGATPRRSRSDYWGENISWVSSSEVAFTRIKATRERITRDGLKNSSVDISAPGTVLLGMIGEGKTRGQVSILDIPACISQNSAAIRVSLTELFPEYVYYYLWGQYNETRQIGSGNNQPALNKTRVQGIAIPFPPLTEQRRIVTEVERHLSAIESSEATVEVSLKRVERLRQSILKQAFSGQLVPQDPSDEPAAALLERIKAEREADRLASASRPKSTRRRSKK